MPDCLASHLPGTLAEVEVVVLEAERAVSQAAASEVLRPEIELPGALRWMRRRVGPIHQALGLLRGLLPERFAHCPARLSAFAALLGVVPVLVALRGIGAPFLADLPTPLGFAPRGRRAETAGSASQQRVGPELPDPGG